MENRMNLLIDPVVLGVKRYLNLINEELEA